MGSWIRTVSSYFLYLGSKPFLLNERELKISKFLPNTAKVLMEEAEKALYTSSIDSFVWSGPRMQRLSLNSRVIGIVDGIVLSRIYTNTSVVSTGN